MSYKLPDAAKRVSLAFLPRSWLHFNGKMKLCIFESSASCDFVSWYIDGYSVAPGRVRSWDAPQWIQLPSAKLMAKQIVASVNTCLSAFQQVHQSSSIMHRTLRRTCVTGTGCLVAFPYSLYVPTTVRATSVRVCHVRRSCVSSCLCRTKERTRGRSEGFETQLLSLQPARAAVRDCAGPARPHTAVRSAGCDCPIRQLLPGTDSAENIRKRAPSLDIGSPAVYRTYYVNPPRCYETPMYGMSHRSSRYRQWNTWGVSADRGRMMNGLTVRISNSSSCCCCCCYSGLQMSY
jgi:hypothetical protein